MVYQIPGIDTSVKYACALNLLQYNPDTDQVVREAGKEGLAIGRPSERGTLWPASFLSELSEVRSKVINNRSGTDVSERSRLWNHVSMDAVLTCSRGRRS